MKDKESRTYTVPLRREWLKVPKWRRSKRAAAALRAFLLKHTKANQVRIGKWANESLWARGAKSPPSKITVTVSISKKKDRKNNELLVATAELAALPAKAKRLAEQAKKRAEKRKKILALKKAKDAEEKKKQEEHKKKTAEEKKELEAAKKKKARAKITKAQEKSIHK